MQSAKPLQLSSVGGGWLWGWVCINTCRNTNPEDRVSWRPQFRQTCPTVGVEKAERSIARCLFKDVAFRLGLAFVCELHSWVQSLPSF